ncbi:MAG: globin [Planctomycetota bacterium]
MAEFGEDGFHRLVAAFYQRVRADDVIGVMYPENDWDGAEWRLRAFLCQRFGLSNDYSQQRGHPRLRMRHMPFAIGPAERDRWLEIMSAAMDETDVPAKVRAILTPFFVQVAEHMRNRD